MLIQAFPRLKGSFLCTCLEDFFRSPAYLVLAVALMTVSEVLGFELEVYYTFLVLVLIGFLFCDDTIAGVPIACCGYMTLSPGNNPVKHPETTAFTDAAFLLQFIVILSLIGALVLAKWAAVLVEKGRNVPFPRLFGGLAGLGIAYMLGGLDLGGVQLRSALFGFAQFVSLALLYVFFITTLDFSRIRKSYIAGLFMAIGFGICIEIADMYTIDGVFQGLTVDRGSLYTGWGVYNNVACIMAMCMPAPAYFAATRRRGWPYTVVTAIFYLAVVFTQSRGGILFGTVMAFLCAFYILLACRREARQGHLVVGIVALASALVVLLFAREKVLDIFHSLVEAGANPSERDTIYVNCWNAFLRAPWFGVGFYETPGFTFDEFSHFMPPRAHDTYMQLLASCGLLGILAYGLHRLDTVVLYLQRPTHEKTFIALVVAALLLTSVVDCNFFNFGPGIIYGVLLAFAEGHSVKRYRHKMLNAYTVMPRCLRGQHLDLPY